MNSARGYRESTPSNLSNSGCNGVCIMSTTWKDEQHPSFINFISSFLDANSYRLNFVPIAPDFIFNCGDVGSAAPPPPFPPCSTAAPPPFPPCSTAPPNTYPPSFANTPTTTYPPTSSAPSPFPGAYPPNSGLNQTPASLSGQQPSAYPPAGYPPQPNAPLAPSGYPTGQSTGNYTAPPYSTGAYPTPPPASGVYPTPPPTGGVYPPRY